MSWIWIVILFAVVIPAATRGARHRRGYGWGEWEWGNGKRPGTRDRIEALEAELDQRLDEIQALEARVSELENRLDFTERLLAAPQSTADA